MLPSIITRWITNAREARCILCGLYVRNFLFFMQSSSLRESYNIISIAATPPIEGLKVALTGWPWYPFLDNDQFFTMELIELMPNSIFFGLQHISVPGTLIRLLHLAPLTRSSHDLLLLCTVINLLVPLCTVVVCK